MEFRVESNTDPAVAEALERGEGWNRARADLERRFALDPAGHFVARDAAGRVIGGASCTVYGAHPESEPFAWIAGTVVREEARGHGVGRALLDAALAHAKTRGAHVIGLDATDTARPLYEKAGFHAIAETTIWTRDPTVPRELPEGKGPVSVIPISFSELLEVSDYDAPRFGASRAPLIAALLSEHPTRCFLAYDREAGHAAGYVQATDHAIGPLVADAPAVAERLLYAAAQAGAPTTLHVLGLNPHTESVLRRAGYAPDGATRTRMIRGTRTHPGRPDCIYATSGTHLG